MKSTLNRVVLADYDLPRQVSLNNGRLPLFLFGVSQALFSYTMCFIQAKWSKLHYAFGKQLWSMRGKSKPSSYHAVTLLIKAAEKGKQRSIHMSLPGFLSSTGFSFSNETRGEWFCRVRQSRCAATIGVPRA